MTDDQQDHAAASGINTGWAVLATLISGMAVWGGAGWLVDWWLGTRFVFPLGLVLGAAGAIVLIVKKYANLDPPPEGPDETDQGPKP